MTAPTDRELAQAYEQGYRDGRKGLELALQAVANYTFINQDARGKDLLKAVQVMRTIASTALSAQDQPATKGDMT